jgi:hypothetical protein
VDPLSPLKQRLDLPRLGVVAQSVDVPLSGEHMFAEELLIPGGRRRVIPAG